MNDVGGSAAVIRSGAIGRVLLVSADDSWSRRVSGLLAREGYALDTCRLGADALDQLACCHANLVVLDLALPDRHGSTVCSLIRASSSVPVIAVGMHSDEQQLVGALSAGADVFVPKLTSDRELVARVRALLRRVPSDGRARESAVLRCGAVELDRGARHVRCDGVPVGTTRREFDLLELLLLRAGRVVSRSDLLDSMWGTNRDPQALDVHVRRLRAKLEAFDAVRRIETVRGVGFRFVLDTQDAALSDDAVVDLRPFDEFSTDEREADIDSALVV